jgi:hypothetical protein
MPGKVNLSVVDYGGETSRTAVYTPVLTAANFDATMALIDTLITAIGNLILGNVWKQVRTAIETLGTKTPPADEEAQRELKWSIVYEDSTTYHRYRVEIPTPDCTLLVANTDLLDLSAGAGAAFKTAFEAVALSPVGNAVEVIEGRLVGRSI